MGTSCSLRFASSTLTLLGLKRNKFPKGIQNAKGKKSAHPNRKPGARPKMKIQRRTEENKCLGSDRASVYAGKLREDSVHERRKGKQGEDRCDENWGVHMGGGDRTHRPDRNRSPNHAHCVHNSIPLFRRCSFVLACDCVSVPVNGFRCWLVPNGCPAGTTPAP